MGTSEKPSRATGRLLRRGVLSWSQLTIHASAPIVLAIGLLITALVCEHQRRLMAKEHLRAEIGIASDVSSVLRSRLAAQATLLSAVVGLFEASESVSPTEFRRFFASLGLADEALKGMQGLGFIAVVPGSDVAGFESHRRAEGLTGFKVTPPGRRPLTTAVLYLEPLEWHNLRSIGRDLYVDLAHREAMRWSAITGEPTITTPVSLVQEKELLPEKGIVLYRPLFTRSAPAARLRRGAAGPAAGLGHHGPESGASDPERPHADRQSQSGGRGGAHLRR